MSKVLVEMIERHADEAAFLWERRDRACRSPLFDLASLADIDRRLEANLEGLVIAGDVGLEKGLAGVARGAAPELFAAVHVAAELGDTMALARLLVAAEKPAGGARAARQGLEPLAAPSIPRKGASARAVVAALAWLSPPRAGSVLGDLVADDCPPQLQRLGIAAHAARRMDPGVTLVHLLSAADGKLRARACRAAGQLGRRDVLPELRRAAREGGDEAGPWAAWSAVLLGDSETLPALWQAAASGGPAAAAACDLAVRCVEAGEAAARLEQLSRSPETLPAALAGAAARGDSACVPWVLQVLESVPGLSRRALWTYATVTGAALEPPLAVRAPETEPSDELLSRSVVEPWEDLPVPESAALRSHWEQVRSGLPPGERRLGGRIIEPAWLAECLRTGVQPWRASAAVELLRASGRGGLFPVHAAGHAQIARLAGLASAASA